MAETLSLTGSQTDATSAVIYPSEFLEGHRAPHGDEALLGALRGGDPGAPARFVDRYLDDVRRILARVLGVDSELDDLTQDVLIAALTGLPRFKGGGGQLRAWVRSIAVFQARKTIRRRTYRRMLLVRARREPCSTPPVASAEVVDALRRVYGALERMKTEDRLVFALRFIDGMKIDEVAAACGISRSTAKRRIGRARAQFSAFAAKDAVLRGWMEESA